MYAISMRLIILVVVSFSNWKNSHKKKIILNIQHHRLVSELCWVNLIERQLKQHLCFTLPLSLRISMFYEAIKENRSHLHKQHQDQSFTTVDQSMLAIRTNSQNKSHQKSILSEYNQRSFYLNLSRDHTQPCKLLSSQENEQSSRHKKSNNSIQQKLMVSGPKYQKKLKAFLIYQKKQQQKSCLLNVKHKAQQLKKFEESEYMEQSFKERSHGCLLQTKLQKMLSLPKIYRQSQDDRLKTQIRYEPVRQRIATPPKVYYIPLPCQSQFKIHQNISTMSLQAPNILYINQSLKYFGEFLRSHWDSTREGAPVNYSLNREPQVRSTYLLNEFKNMVKQAQLANSQGGPKLLVTNSNLYTKSTYASMKKKTRVFHPLEFSKDYIREIRKDNSQFTRLFLQAVQEIPGEDFRFEDFLRFYRLFVSKQADKPQKVAFLLQFLIRKHPVSDQNKCLLKQVVKRIHLVSQNSKRYIQLEDKEEEIRRNLTKVLLDVDCPDTLPADCLLKVKRLKQRLEENPDSVYILISLMLAENQRQKK